MAVRTPLVSVRVYDQGEGDPLVTKHGFGVYDVIKPASEGGGLVSVGSDGYPTLRVMPGVGLTCRERYAPVDTWLSQFSTTGESWSWMNSMSAAGGTGRRVYLLRQVDASGNFSWRADSAYQMPENPSLAFLVDVSQPPANHNSFAMEPWAMAAFGGEFAVKVTPDGDVSLMRWEAGSGWREMAQLGQAQAISDGVVRAVAFVRVQRGRLCVSLDYGRTWSLHANADGTALTVKAGRVSFIGQGVVASFGVHQLQYVQGTYLSPSFNTFTGRDPSTETPALTYRGTVPTGTSVGLQDAASGAGTRVARYRATLTPSTVPAEPFAVHRSPDVQAVQLEYAPVVAAPSGAYTTPWDGAVTSVRISRPLELSEASAAITASRSAFLPFTGNLRNRKLEVWLGWDVNGTQTWARRFTGYVRRVSLTRGRFGAVEVEVEAVALPGVLQARRWSALQTTPLGGLTVNQAMDKVLSLEGLGASYRSWHAAGAAVVLPAGSAEDPFETPSPGETRWETLERLASYAGLELGVTDDGLLVTVPVGYADASTSRTYSLGAGTVSEEEIRDVRHLIDFSESATAVEVTGATAGGPALAWVADSAAEADKSSPRFAGGRELVQEAVGGEATPGLLTARAQTLARQHLAVKKEADVTTDLDLSARRRARVELYGGSSLGIPDGTQAVVLTVDDEAAVGDDGAYELRVTGGLRLLGA